MQNRMQAGPNGFQVPRNFDLKPILFIRTKFGPKEPFGPKASGAKNDFGSTNVFGSQNT